MSSPDLPIGLLEIWLQRVLDVVVDEDEPKLHGLLIMGGVPEISSQKILHIYFKSISISVSLCLAVLALKHLRN